MVLQCNVDDHLMGVPEIALNKYGFEALEFKFGQCQGNSTGQQD